MIKQKIKKIILISLVALEIILLNTPAVYAFSWPSPTSAARQIANYLEQRYHISGKSVRNQGEIFNVSDTKKTVPQVMLFFNPTDPKPGEKITAEALPTYFSNPKESLYYVWYLRKVYDVGGRRIECKDKNNPSAEEKKYCDKDGDGRITENDWKIEAMRMITNGGFDTAKADYDPGASDKKDNDGYQAIWGGDDRDKRWEYFDENYYLTNSDGNYINEPSNSNHVHCYIHDFQGGENYELVGFSSSTSIDCPAGTSAVCVDDETIDCPSLDGLTMTDYHFCKESDEDPSCDPETDEAICSAGHAVCASTLTSYSCSSPPATQYGSSCNALYPTYIATPPTCTITNSDSRRNTCRHLFPRYKNFDGSLDLGGNNNNVNIDLDGEKVGDNSFRDDEEAFWKTNPDDADTADNGNKDEASAVGLGLNAFTWNYTPGDKVGVVVEGNSMIPTKHDDSTMMIMWALPKNKCEISASSKDSYHKRIKGYSVEIPTAAVDINDCLEDNLVDPREEGQPKRMDISLSYSPENPVNDPSGETGDVVVVDASSSNSDQELSQLEYNWDVYVSPDGSINPLSWTSITKKLVDAGLVLGPIKGNNISSLSLRMGLNKAIIGSSFDDYFPSGIGYLKIQVTVREYYAYSSGDEMVREGKNDIIIKINSSSEKIEAYMAKVDASGGLMLDIAICQDPTSGQKTPLCYVLKNEIIGVKVDNQGLTNFSWALDGKPLVCNTTLSSQCTDEKQENVNFFPVTGNPGTNYTVSVTANDPVSGKSLSLSRVFQVIDPFIKINTVDRSIAWPKYLGYYTDLEGSYFADESDSVFQTNEGILPVMKVEFHPDWIKNYISPEKMECKVDGNVVALTGGANNYIIEVPDPGEGNRKVPGDVFNIECQAFFSQPPEIRKALNNLWDISQFESTEKYLSDKVQIEVVAQGEDLSSISNLLKPKKLMAALIQNLPSQFTFLLRIVLTIIVIILATAVVFAFIPETYETKKIS